MKGIEKKLLLKTKQRKNKKSLVKFIKLYSVIKIQTAFRKYQLKIQLSVKETQSFTNTDRFLNDTTFVGKKLNEIKEEYFYKHSNYFFDIRELVQHLSYSSKHPYTNTLFNRFTKNQILRIHYNLINNHLNYKSLDEENSENLSYKNIISSLKTDIFLKLDSKIGVSNITIFNNYDEVDLYHYVDNLTNYSLIQSVIDVNNVSYKVNYLYDNFLREQDFYENRRNINYLDTFYKHRFRYHYTIFNLLLEIMNHNDEHQCTRYYIINEQIVRNTFNLAIYQNYQNSNNEISVNETGVNEISANEENNIDIINNIF
jgi:hypothetical protein